MILFLQVLIVLGLGAEEETCLRILRHLAEQRAIQAEDLEHYLESEPGSNPVDFASRLGPIEQHSWREAMKGAGPGDELLRKEAKALAESLAKGETREKDALKTTWIPFPFVLQEIPIDKISMPQFIPLGKKVFMVDEETVTDLETTEVRHFSVEGRWSETVEYKGNVYLLFDQDEKVVLLDLLTLEPVSGLLPERPKGYTTVRAVHGENPIVVFKDYHTNETLFAPFGTSKLVPGPKLNWKETTFFDWGSPFPIAISTSSGASLVDPRTNKVVDKIATVLKPKASLLVGGRRQLVLQDDGEPHLYLLDIETKEQRKMYAGLSRFDGTVGDRENSFIQLHFDDHSAGDLLEILHPQTGEISLSSPLGGLRSVHSTIFREHPVIVNIEDEGTLRIRTLGDPEGVTFDLDADRLWVYPKGNNHLYGVMVKNNSKRQKGGTWLVQLIGPKPP